MTKAQQLGSITAKGGFLNETDICKKFQDFHVESFTFPSSANKITMLKTFLDSKEQHQHLTIQRDDIKFKENIKIMPDMFGNYPQKPIRVSTVNKEGQGERIYSPQGHAITLSVYGGGVGAKTGLYLISNHIRRLSPHECRRITGFPDNFKLHTKPTVCYRQFGNSIVVNILKSILERVIHCNILTKKTMRVAS